MCLPFSRHLRLRPLLAAVLCVGFVIMAFRYGLQAVETHRSFAELKNFERLMDLGVPGSTPFPYLLIVQHFASMGPLEVASRRSHAAYARAWGYKYRHDRRNYVPKARNGSNNKLYTILAAMDAEMGRAEWIIYCDADTVIRDPGVPIHSLLPPDTLSPLPRILGNEDHNGLNAGVMVFRVDQETRGFIAALINDLESNWLVNWSDQHRIQALLRSDPTFGAHFYRIPKTWFNAYWLDEADDDGSQLQVHFVNWLKYRYPFRPVLEHASAIVADAIDKFGVKGRHPVQNLRQGAVAKKQGETYWSQNAVSGVKGMSFLDEEVGGIIYVP